jgi:uncharacterized membrane-anchored protein
MASRLGEVLYWAATLIAVLIFGVIAYGDFYGTGRADPFLQGAAIFLAGVIWLIGLACRYVLSGSKRAGRSSN